ncbi:hypothetical protein FGG78_37030, partial [Thioclava sp. BHET1]
MPIASAWTRCWTGMRLSAEIEPAVLRRLPVRLDGAAPAPPALRGGVLLLGSFDGLHAGHRALFALARRQAQALGAPLGVLQCDPHPRQFFRAETGFRIACGAVQDALLTAAGVDYLYAPRFDAAFAGLTAERFVTDHLVARLGVVAVVSGTDFRFGRGRGGDVTTLARLGRSHGFAHLCPAEVCDDRSGARISSTLIREALCRGDLATATRLLGRALVTEVRPRAEGGWG